MGIIIDLSLDYIIILGLFIGFGGWSYWSFTNKCKKNYALSPYINSTYTILLRR